MCGIAGVYNFRDRRPVDPIVLRRMTDIIEHRGPDDEGHFIDGHVGLGHRRLSIIDLSPSGRQPMANATGDAWITYNGECYNYRELRAELRAGGYEFRSESDTEVVLALYDRHGIDVLQRIEGMFAFAIWDARRERLLLVRDRIGIKPLFYYHDGSRLLFASELKALLADPSLRCEVDYGALAAFFRLMSIPDPQSIFRDVKKLLPGHYLLLERGRVSIHQYWDIPSVAPVNGVSVEDTVRAFRSEFAHAIKSHMVADVPVGAFLSGGVDSSAVVAMAARENPAPLRTFAISFGGLAAFDEAPFAAKVAALYGTAHEQFEMTPDLVRALPEIVWHGDEPSGISSSLGVYFLAQAARQHVKVVLTGDGGDEIFAGYPWRHRGRHGPLARLLSNVVAMWPDRLGSGPRERKLKKVARTIAAPPAEAYALHVNLYGPGELAQLLSAEMREAARATGLDPIERHYNQLPTAGDLTRKLYTDMKTTLVSEMLTKVDRMTMAFGLEARVPFLDRRLVEWAFRIPESHKFNGGEGKFVVKRAMEGLLPSEILYRSKHGFNVPLRQWMTNELAHFTSDTLTSTRFRQRGLVMPRMVDTLLKRLFKNGEDCSNHVFELVALELWFQRYVDHRQELKSLASVE
jgi:asparagine synthase (glutamine-hydrolysing)